MLTVRQSSLCGVLRLSAVTTGAGSSPSGSIGAAQVICRVHPGLQREDFLFDFRSQFGIDYLFSSERLAAVELAKFVRNPHSIFVESAGVTLSSPTPGAAIRYTLDGTPPDETSPRYEKPLVLTGTATVKARAFVPGLDDANHERD